MRTIAIIIACITTVGCNRTISNSEFESRYGKITTIRSCITEAHTDQNKIVQYIDTPKGKQILWVGNKK